MDSQRYKVRYKKTLQQIANTLLDHFCQEVSYTRLRPNSSTAR